MKEINLFKIEKEASEKEKILITRVRLISFVVLIVYCLISVGIFTFWFWVRRKDKKIAEQIVVQEEKIKNLENMEALHLFLKQRLSYLAPFLEEEKINYEFVFFRLASLLPEGIILEDIDVNQTGELTFGGIAPNAVVLADFMERLLAPESDDFSTNIGLLSASRQEDGTYTFSFFVDVKT